MKARHLAEYAGLWLLAIFFRALPRPWALALGAVVGQVGWWLRIRRQLVFANLEIAFPELSLRERQRLAAAAARNFGRTVAEFVRFAGRDRRRVSQLVAVEGEQELREALAQGKGAIVVTAHLGAWALYVTALAARGIPCALLVGRQHNPYVDRFILGIPGDAVKFISKGRTAPREILKSLQEGRAVVMVADQDAGPRGTFAPFFGRPVSTLPLPGAIVARYRPPLFVMVGHRVGGGRHQLRLQPLSVPTASDEEQVRLAVAATCNAALEAAIRTYPDQYFWYHRRFRHYPEITGPTGAMQSGAS
ncbi:MAG: lysophospholipid acyltransferase family protein [Acidobacteriota bacterium]